MLLFLVLFVVVDVGAEKGSKTLGIGVAVGDKVAASCFGVLERERVKWLLLFVATVADDNDVIILDSVSMEGVAEEYVEEEDMVLVAVVTLAFLKISDSESSSSFELVLLLFDTTFIVDEIVALVEDAAVTEGVGGVRVKFSNNDRFVADVVDNDDVVLDVFDLVELAAY